MGVDLDDNQLSFLRDKLKCGDYDGVDTMHAWLAIDELRELRSWKDKAILACPSLNFDN